MVHQLCYFNLPHIEQVAANQLLPDGCITFDTTTCKAWCFETYEDVNELEPLLSVSGS